ncbi:MAG: hypothetical protein M0P01_13690 [Treponema sp.]|nr:hypothetical protein [Treponema sp.]
MRQWKTIAEIRTSLKVKETDSAAAYFLFEYLGETRKVLYRDILYLELPFNGDEKGNARMKRKSEQNAAAARGKRIRALSPRVSRQSPPCRTDFPYGMHAVERFEYSRVSRSQYEALTAAFIRWYRTGS